MECANCGRELPSPGMPCPVCSEDLDGKAADYFTHHRPGSTDPSQPSLAAPVLHTLDFPSEWTLTVAQVLCVLGLFLYLCIGGTIDVDRDIWPLYLFSVPVVVVQQLALVIVFQRVKGLGGGERGRYAYHRTRSLEAKVKALEQRLLDDNEQPRNL